MPQVVSDSMTKIAIHTRKYINFGSFLLSFGISLNLHKSWKTYYYLPMNDEINNEKNWVPTLNRTRDYPLNAWLPYH